MNLPLAASVSLTLLLSANGEEDNRIKHGLKVGDKIPDAVEEVFLTELALRSKIASFHNQDLTRAFNARDLMLRWQRRVALKDADYILCLFDSSIRVEPGNNPRVLILLTPDYQLKSWGSFICEPSFASGHIINRLSQQHTYFVTVNSSGRFGGTLSFEKYLISSNGIRKLGEANEITKIPDAQ